MKIPVIFLILLFVRSWVYCAEPPAFDKCFEDQQKAIAELIQAMKDVKKIIVENKDDDGGGSKEKKDNPFKDKQKYEMPELKKEKNPEYQLGEIKKEQDEVLKELDKPSGDNNDKMKKQADITDKLDKMSGNENLNKDLKKKLADAAETSRAAEKALSSNENDIARTSGMKVLAELKKVLDEIGEKSNKEAADTASEIKKDINRAQREIEKGNKEKAGSSMNDALAKAIDATKKQLDSGKFSNAEKMNDVSKMIKEDKAKLSKNDAAKATEEFDKLRKEISSSLKNKDALQGMRENLKKMDALAKELKYLERNKNKTSAADIRKVFEDIQLDAQEIGGYALELSGGVLPAATEMDKLLEEILKKDENRTVNNEKLKSTLELAEKIIADGNAMLANVTGNKQLNIFTAEDAPPEYRKAVSKYFERLSSEAQENSKKK